MQMLRAIEAGHKRALETSRADMPGFKLTHKEP